MDEPMNMDDDADVNGMSNSTSSHNGAAIGLM